MVPKDKVISLHANDTVRQAGELIIGKRIGSVVVLGDSREPLGIVTRTELVKAYITDHPVTSPVSTIMNSDLLYIDESQQRDGLAELMMKKKRHHVLVKDSQGHYVGLATSLDVVTEAALDARSFPYNRQPSKK